MRRLIFLCLMYAITLEVVAQQTWRGLNVEKENRCSNYDKKLQYPYSQSIEDEIVARMGGQIYGPYTGTYFLSDSQTDIEHIVAASEGHDSGLCGATAETRKQFANDLLNLTLAAPKVNRCSSTGKCGLDPAEWMPPKNKCWYANRVVEIKRKYSLSVDQKEAESLESVLSDCDSVEMVFYPKSNKSMTNLNAQGLSRALELYDDNNNGRITCAEAIKHKIAPVNRNHIAYKYMNDRNKDGIVCE